MIYNIHIYLTQNRLWHRDQLRHPPSRQDKCGCSKRGFRTVSSSRWLPLLLPWRNISLDRAHRQLVYLFLFTLFWSVSITLEARSREKSCEKKSFFCEKKRLTRARECGRLTMRGDPPFPPGCISIGYTSIAEGAVLVQLSILACYITCLTIRYFWQ